MVVKADNILAITSLKQLNLVSLNFKLPLVHLCLAYLFNGNKASSNFVKGLVYFSEGAFGNILPKTILIRKFILRAGLFKLKDPLQSSDLIFEVDYSFAYVRESHFNWKIYLCFFRLALSLRKRRKFLSRKLLYIAT